MSKTRYDYAKDGYAVDKSGNPVHRLIYTATYGKPPAGWHVHHIDYHKLNNDPGNLIALPPKFHNELHRKYPVPALNREALEREVAGLLEMHTRLQAECAAAREALREAEHRLQSALGVEPTRNKRERKAAAKAAKRARHKAHTQMQRHSGPLGSKGADKIRVVKAAPQNDVMTILRKKAGKPLPPDPT